jgi:hypothetical protein
MNQEETLKLLREAHEEPIAEAHYAAVRARVLSQLAAQRRPWRGWAYGFAAAAALVIVLAVVKVGRTPWSARGPLAPLYVPPSQSLLSSERPARGPAADQGVRPTLRQAAKRRPQVAKLPHNSGVIGPPIAQPLMVKLVTDDPNIVIYWISGE